MIYDNRCTWHCPTWHDSSHERVLFRSSAGGNAHRSQHTGPSTQVQTLKAQLGLWKDRRDCDCAAGCRGTNVSTDRESYRTRVKMEMLGGVDAYVNYLPTSANPTLAAATLSTLSVSSVESGTVRLPGTSPSAKARTVKRVATSP